MNWLIREFRQETGIDLTTDRMAVQRLRDAAEKAKVELSTVMETEINLPFITADASGPKHLVLTLSRSRLEQMVSSLLDRVDQPCRQALQDAGWSTGEVGEVILVGGMTRMPAVQQKVSQLFSKEPHRNVNPDEAVALGAAVQGGVLTGDVRDILLLDVTPLTLGLETLGSVSTALHRAQHNHPHGQDGDLHHGSGWTDKRGNTRAPGRAADGDGQQVHRALHSRWLYYPRPRGVPQIEVTFDIDANGILSVAARDKGTGREQKIVIQPDSGLAKDDIDRMVNEAQQFAAEDQRKREEAEVRNQAESLVYNTEKMLADNADKVPEDLKQEVEGKVATLKQALQNNDLEGMRSGIADLNASMQRLGQAVYAQAGAPTGPDMGDMPGDDQQPGGTVEGEYREL